MRVVTDVTVVTHFYIYIIYFLFITPNFIKIIFYFLNI